MGTDPRVLAVLVVVALAVYGGGKVVHGAKKAETKIVHAEAKIVHVFHRK